MARATEAMRLLWIAWTLAASLLADETLLSKLKMQPGIYVWDGLTRAPAHEPVRLYRTAR